MAILDALCNTRYFIANVFQNLTMAKPWNFFRILELDMQVNLLPIIFTI